MSGLTPEQDAYFDRAERMFGKGKFSETIEEAKQDLTRRNAGGVVRSGNRVIGFVPEKEKEDSSE